MGVKSSAPYIPASQSVYYTLLLLICMVYGMCEIDDTVVSVCVSHILYQLNA